MCSEIRIPTKVKKHPLATNQASDGMRPPQSVATTGRLILPAPTWRLSLLGSLVWAGAAPKPHAGSSDGDTGIEVLSQVVTWLVLMWFREANRDKNRVCDALVFFLRAADGLGCAKSLRRSRCDCSCGPTSHNGGFSPLK